MIKFMEELKYVDFELKDYKYYKSIKASMVAKIIDFFIIEYKELLIINK